MSGPRPTSGVLREILDHKRVEIAERRQRRPLAEVRRRAEAEAAARPFIDRVRARRPAVIAEIKRASPSEGVIRADFEPAAIARDYEAAGAACLSVLTDRKFFGGDEAHLRAARCACALPTLRKDFVVDAYQVYETRALGADCLLLIVACLEQTQLEALAGLAVEVGLDVLVEVHDRAELDRALRLGPRLVGINNRNLRTFATRLETTLDLLDAVPPAVAVVAESGVRTAADVLRLEAAGVRAFLIGTALMRADSPGEALRALLDAAAGERP